ncbi:MAG: asparagine--tRNA ligase [Pseudomonadota bacterium]
MTTIAKLFNQEAALDETVTIKGWLRTRRDSKAGFSFLAIHDGSCFAPIQVVVNNTIANYQTEILKLTAGCSVIISGKLVASQGKGQQFEIQAETVKVLGWVEDPDSYPISPKHHTLEYLRDVAHLRARTNTFGAIARIRHCVAHAIHQFFHEQGFLWLPTPIITASDCEGAGELFRVSTLDLANLPKTDHEKINFNEDFFAKEAFLTVSGQLNAETYALALQKVYTFGPTFRAENSNTARHLAEFWMIEPEVAFADLHDVADLAEKLLKHIFQTVLHERQDDMQFFNQRYEKTAIERLNKIIDQDFERLDYTDAIKLLEKAKKAFEYPVKWGIDLQTEHERYLAEDLIGKPVIVMNYPKDIKAFYMRLNDDAKTVAAMDVLAPGIGEIIGGSQREERLDVLDQRMQAFAIEPKDYQWYRDLRRYGTVPHAGFGLGFERLLAYISGLSNVRDISPFPRTPGNAKF